MAVGAEDGGFNLPPMTPTDKKTEKNQTGDGNVWLPKWQDDIFVNTSDPQGISGASDKNSPTYNYSSSAADATAEFASGEGYMGSEMTGFLNNVAKAIHPLKTGKTLWEDAVNASASLWQNHRIRKTPYQIISEWAADITPKGAKGGDGNSGRSGSSAAAPMPADSSAIRRAMDTVTTQLLGRTMSDKEFNRYYSSYVKEFGGNPDMDATQNMIEAAKSQEDYAEYTIATQFAGALDKVLRGAA
jgi:hypothetical protein